MATERDRIAALLGFEDDPELLGLGDEPEDLEPLPSIKPPGFGERLGGVLGSLDFEESDDPFSALASGFRGGLATRAQQAAKRRQELEQSIAKRQAARDLGTIAAQRQRRTGLQTLGKEAREAVKARHKVTKEDIEAAPEGTIIKRLKPGADVSQKEFDQAMLREPKEEGPASQGALSLSPAGLDIAARMYSTTGMLPPMGIGKATAGIRTRIINRAAEIDPNLNIAANKAGFESNKSALTNLKRIHNSSKAFEQTALRNAKVLERTMQKAIDTGSPWLNRPIRLLATATGDPAMSAFNAALQTVTPEFARLLSSPTASGQLTDSARHEIATILSKDATPRQILAALDVLRQDARNRTMSYEGQVKALEWQIANPGKDRPSLKELSGGRNATQP